MPPILGIPQFTTVAVERGEGRRETGSREIVIHGSGNRFRRKPVEAITNIKHPHFLAFSGVITHVHSNKLTSDKYLGLLYFVTILITSTYQVKM